PGYRSAPVCSPGKRSATGERFPDGGWRLIRATGLMHAMGPNVAGVIGSAIAAGVMLKYVLAM
ncbi:sodium ion-translocating decarboxylase subunit beta, partial [Klebsiella aerogenes]|uniref:sodium ion-translocating decarboxylase subunit beta n=1 Tax=Klebsiella aerogenes TaxID=548 RepID=UPI001E3AD28B